MLASIPLSLPPSAGREEHLARFLRDYPPWGASLPHDLAWIAIKGRQGVGAAAGGGAAAPLVGPYEASLAWAGRS